MTKAQQTKSRRAAVLSVLGAGWKASAGVDGCRDMYKCRDVVVMPQRTVDGNFYVGSHARGNRYTQTLEQAAELAAKWLQ
jgi:hypothetical protein